MDRVVQWTNDSKKELLHHNSSSNSLLVGFKQKLSNFVEITAAPLKRLGILNESPKKNIVISSNSCSKRYFDDQSSVSNFFQKKEKAFDTEPRFNSTEASKNSNFHVSLSPLKLSTFVDKIYRETPLQKSISTVAIQNDMMQLNESSPNYDKCNNYYRTAPIEKLRGALTGNSLGSLQELADKYSDLVALLSDKNGKALTKAENEKLKRLILEIADPNVFFIISF